MIRKQTPAFIAVLLLFNLLPQGLRAQQIGITTNALYWLTVTPNAGVEYAFNRQMSLAGQVQYNPFTFKDNRKWKHWLVQPEYRYWFSEAFKGHYLGGHLSVGGYNFGNLPFGGMKEYRYQGYLYGTGFSYGYQWIVGNRVNIGAEIGFGYWYMDYDKFYCETCGERIEHYRSHYFGPTKLGVHVIYLLK